MCQSDCGSHSSRRWLGSNVPRRSVPGHVLSTILPHTGMLAVQPSSSPLRSLCLKQHVMSDNSNLAPCPTARCCHSGPRANGGLHYVSKNVPSLIAYNITLIHIHQFLPIFGTCHQQIQSNGPWKQFRGGTSYKKSIKVGRNCWKHRFWAWNERVKEYGCLRVVMITKMTW